MRTVLPQLSAAQPQLLSDSREAKGNDEPSHLQSKSQYIVSLKMENAVLKAELAEICARECLSSMQHMPSSDASPPSTGLRLLLTEAIPSSKFSPNSCLFWSQDAEMLRITLPAAACTSASGIPSHETGLRPVQASLCLKFQLVSQS